MFRKKVISQRNNKNHIHIAANECKMNETFVMARDLGLARLRDYVEMGRVTITIAPSTPLGLFAPTFDNVMPQLPQESWYDTICIEDRTLQKVDGLFTVDVILYRRFIRVKSSHPNATGVYELFAAPSPHHGDLSAGLPQLPENEDEQYPQYAVGNTRSYLVFKYSFYNREKDVERHEAAQAMAKEAAERKKKPFNPSPFKEKGTSRGTWTYLYSTYDGVVVE